MKLIGYILMIVGVVILLLGTSFLKPVNDKLPESIKKIAGSKSSLIVGIVILIIGAFFVYTRGSNSKAAKEVPIYHGKQIVGYRRMRVL